MRRREESAMESGKRTWRKTKRMTSLGGNLAQTLNRSLLKEKLQKRRLVFFITAEIRLESFQPVMVMVA